MSDTIFTNEYFVIALMVAFIILLYLYSQTRSCIIENTKRSTVKEEFTKTNTLIMNDSNKDAINKITMNDDNQYTLLEFGGDNYGRYYKRKSTINGIPQPLDMRPDLSQCQPCQKNTNIIEGFARDRSDRIQRRNYFLDVI